MSNDVGDQGAQEPLGVRKVTPGHFMRIEKVRQTGEVRWHDEPMRRPHRPCTLLRLRDDYTRLDDWARK